MPPHEALLSALVRIVDEAMHLTFASHRASAAEAAASALSLLVAIVEVVGADATPPWALTAATDRAQRALASPMCPQPVQAAASRAIERMRQLL